MRSFTTIFLLASVMIGVSYGFIISPPKDSAGHLMEHVRTVAKDLKESLAHKRKAAIDTAYSSFNKHSQNIELESSQPSYISKLQELQHNIVKHPLLQFLSQPLFKFPTFPRKEDSSKSQIKINGIDYVFVPASKPGYNIQPYNQPEDVQDGQYTYVNVQPQTEPVKPLSREEEPPILYGSLSTGYNSASTYTNNVS